MPLFALQSLECSESPPAKGWKTQPAKIQISLPKALRAKKLRAVEELIFKVKTFCSIDVLPMHRFLEAVNYLFITSPPAAMITEHRRQ